MHFTSTKSVLKIIKARSRSRKNSREPYSDKEIQEINPRRKLYWYTKMEIVIPFENSLLGLFGRPRIVDWIPEFNNRIEDQTK